MKLTMKNTVLQKALESTEKKLVKAEAKLARLDERRDDREVRSASTRKKSLEEMLNDLALEEAEDNRREVVRLREENQELRGHVDKLRAEFAELAALRSQPPGPTSSLTA